jgi:hypothetical protein
MVSAKTTLALGRTVIVLLVIAHQVKYAAAVSAAAAELSRNRGRRDLVPFVVTARRKHG